MQSAPRNASGVIAQWTRSASPSRVDGDWLHDRIPEDLWQAFWRDLPQRDRLAITHVCSAWRRLALSMPLVWANVEAIVFSPMAADEDVIWSNAASLPILLSRSASANLHLTVFIVDPGPLDPAVRPLMQAVQPHADRVRYLRIVTARSTRATAAVLDSVAFTKLRVLVCDRSEVLANYDLLGYNPLLRPEPLYNTYMGLRAPHLEVLKLTPAAFRFTFDGTALPQMPFITSLAFSASSLTDILIPLRACPNLAEVELDVSYYAASSRPADLIPEISTRALGSNGCLQTLRVCGIRKTHELAEMSGFAPLISSRDRHSLDLVYAIDGESPDPICGLKTFADLHGPVRLCMWTGYNNNVLTLHAAEVEAASARTRKLRFECHSTKMSFRGLPLGSLWTIIDLARIVELEINVGMVMIASYGLAEFPFPAVQRARIISPGLASLEDYLAKLNWAKLLPSATDVELVDPELPFGHIKFNSAVELEAHLSPLKSWFS